MSQDPIDKPVPTVLIIGAGIAGLTLAVLLEQADIPYHIFERASVVKPLGSAMCFGGNLFHVMEQLGIYQELLEVSKPNIHIKFYNANCKKIGNYDVSENVKIVGYDNLAFSRPDFYEILRKRVPVHKISFQKKVLRSEEKEGKVHIHCSDNTTYIGDILVGADGAYSGVRQSMYKDLNAKGILPKGDLEGFTIGYTTVVGVAKPPNPENYPALKEKYANFSQVLYKNSNSCYIVTLPNNQISWGFAVQRPKEELREMHFRSSDWGSEINDTSLENFRDLPCPLGGTMGDIFDATPKDLISKVFLEEKVFKTWHHSRTVLIGDACHKYHPSGGQGGAMAIHDVVALANCIYNMPDTSSKSIKLAFDDYYKQRFHYAIGAYRISTFMTKVMNGQRLAERLLRKVFINYIPERLLRIGAIKGLAYRPQAVWLPLTENRGYGPILPQENKRNDGIDIAPVKAVVA
ncbi:hypothetical protein BGX27_000457 [Mortierella sp. AM989]|nr:hypothetical protein BGX27_000457 [Mortierella sp. AM989]